MKTTSQTTRLLLPALRGTMGDWFYYVCVMRMKDIAQRVRPVPDIHDTKTLSDWIQRQLQEGHTDLIRNYLESQPQRLFNALVIGVYGGSPEFCEVKISHTEKAQREGIEELALDGILGFLRLEGTEELFAIDGQHRVVGIQKALEDDAELGDEEVATLFVAHSKTKEGMERTRRLFTVLNRHAKAVSKMELIALDDDDVIAIITRKLIDEFPLFQDKIYLKKGKNIPPTDETSVTSIITLYDALDDYFKQPKIGKITWNVFKRARPYDDLVLEYYSKAEDMLSALLKHFPPLAQVAKSKASSGPVATYRSSKGGLLYFRPIGFQLLLRAMRMLTDNGYSVQDAAATLAQMPWELNQQPWKGLLWNPTGSRMITLKEHQAAALRVVAYGVGLDLKLVKSSKASLEADLDKLEVDVKLKKYTK